jgi:endonuclease/exonuclease/phosphatase (EEP) superfamily protein YafD
VAVVHWRRKDEARWRLVAWLAVVAAVLLGAGALLLHWIATPWRYVIVVTALAHYLMWAAPIGLVGALALRRWWTSGAAAVVTALVLAVQLPAEISDVDGRHGDRLVVLQANLMVGGAHGDVLARIVRRNHVDLLATEELTTAEQQRLLAAGLGRRFPYRFLRPLPTGGGGLGLWSRYPLDRVRDVPGFWLGVLSARVALPGGPATVLAVHVTPPYPYPDRRWRRELTRLRTVLPRDGAVLAAGDFNATTDHAQFRHLLAHGYADAAEQAGAGYLPTYPNDRWYGPVIGIDHVLVRGGLAADRVDTVAVAGSDHRALLVGLVPS